MKSKKQKKLKELKNLTCLFDFGKAEFNRSFFSSAIAYFELASQTSDIRMKKEIYLYLGKSYHQLTISCFEKEQRLYFNSCAIANLLNAINAGNLDLETYELLVSAYLETNNYLKAANVLCIMNKIYYDPELDHQIAYYYFIALLIDPDAVILENVQLINDQDPLRTLILANFIFCQLPKSKRFYLDFLDFFNNHQQQLANFCTLDVITAVKISQLALASDYSYSTITRIGKQFNNTKIILELYPDENAFNSLNVKQHKELLEAKIAKTNPDNVEHSTLSLILRTLNPEFIFTFWSTPSAEIDFPELSKSPPQVHTKL